MSLKVPDLSERTLLDKLLGSGIGACAMHLYKTNITPGDSDTISTYSGNEATFTGYMQQSIMTPWGSATGDGSGRAVATTTQVTFTSSADQTAQDIYGYYVESSGVLLWAEKFVAGPVTISHNGDKIKVTPRLTLKSEF